MMCQTPAPLITLATISTNLYCAVIAAEALPSIRSDPSAVIVTPCGPGLMCLMRKTQPTFSSAGGKSSVTAAAVLSQTIRCCAGVRLIFAGPTTLVLARFETTPSDISANAGGLLRFPPQLQPHISHS